MSGFLMRIDSPRHSERFDGVLSFVGADASGSFGIMAGHVPFMTVLRHGLAKFLAVDSAWQYIALTGGVLHFADGELRISARRFLLDSDYQRVSSQLEERLRAEEQSLQSVRENLRELEQAMLRRLLALRRT